MAKSPPAVRKVPDLVTDRGVPLQAKLRLLEDWLARRQSEDGFNGTVLIARDGAVLCEHHCGFADFDTRAPLVAQSSFSLTSASKPFTALAIQMLAHRNLLSLDDPLSRFIPELPDFGAFTIRSLLHHTSGIPDHLELADVYWNPNTVLTMPDVIALFQEHRPRPYFPQGSAFEYSNTGYVMLGEIVARAAKSTYPVFMADNIFGPAGMTDSAAFNLSVEDDPLRARAIGFRRTFGKIERRDMNFIDGLFGDGGIFASAADLHRWDVALRAGAFIPAEIYAQSYAPGILTGGKATGYGFGWEIEPRDVVEHWGEWEGFTSYLRRDLGKNTLLVVLSNLGPPEYVDPISTELGVFVANL